MANQEIFFILSFLQNVCLVCEIISRLGNYEGIALIYRPRAMGGGGMNDIKDVKIYRKLEKQKQYISI